MDLISEYSMLTKVSIVVDEDKANKEFGNEISTG